MEEVQGRSVFSTVFNTVFVTLGIIFVFVVMAVGYFIIADPFRIKPTLFGSSSGELQSETAAVVANTEIGTPTMSESFTLSEAQKNALVGLGIDPATVPSTITPLQATCFEEKLGANRVSEIRDGGVPSAFELFKVEGCIN